MLLKERHSARLIVTLTMVMGSGGCGGSDDAAGPTTTLDEGEGIPGEFVVSGGQVRNYLLHLPEGSVTGPIPVILALHGASTTAAWFEQVTPVHTLAGEAGFATVYADGLGGSWRAQCDCTPADGAGLVDDILFLRTLVGQLEESFGIDPTRVYAVGLSQGALMTHNVACRYGAGLRGIVSIAATASGIVTDECGTLSPSVLFIHGDEDPQFPWEGKRPTQDNRILSMMDTLERWRSMGGCTVGPTMSLWPDVDPDDGTRVREHRWTGCQGPTEVTLLQIEGGGHTWPMPVTRYSVTLGRFSEELGGSQVAVDFFSGIDAPLR